MALVIEIRDFRLGIQPRSKNFVFSLRDQHDVKEKIERITKNVFCYIATHYVDIEHACTTEGYL